MTEEFQQSAEASVDVPNTAGAQLKQAREAQGYSVEDTAVRLNISAKYIRALEASDITSLPRLPFVRGYIRSYARFLELSGDQLIANFNHEFDRSEEQKVATINKVGSQVKLSDPWMRTSVYLFFLAVLGISIWWWQTQSGNSLQDLLNFGAADVVEQVPAEQDTVELSSDQAIADNDPTDIQTRLAAREQQLEQQGVLSNAVEEEIEVESSVQQEPAYLSAEQIQRLTQQLEQNQSEGTVSEHIEPLPSDAADAEPEAQSVVAPSAEQEKVVVVIAEKIMPVLPEKPVGVLRLSFVSDCWVSIRDANDKLVYANTKRAGDSLELKLEMPGNLLVGRVSAVQQAQFNGNDLNLSDFAKKDVARVVLK